MPAKLRCFAYNKEGYLSHVAETVRDMAKWLGTVDENYIRKVLYEEPGCYTVRGYYLKTYKKRKLTRKDMRLDEREQRRKEQYEHSRFTKNVTHPYSRRKKADLMVKDNFVRIGLELIEKFQQSGRRGDVLRRKKINWQYTLEIMCHRSTLETDNPPICYDLIMKKHGEPVEIISGEAYMSDIKRQLEYLWSCYIRK